MITAIPWPPPMQAEPIASLPPVRRSSWTKCDVILAPEVARGCPKAIAPPLTFVLSVSRSNSLMTAKVCAANASLTFKETKSISNFIDTG